GVDASLGPIYVHGAIANTNEALMHDGYQLPKTQRVEAGIPKSAYRGALVVAPPSALGSPWAKKFQPYSTGIASGWMALRGQRRRRAADRGFILSDHADWPGLLQAIEATGAERVLTTHGYAAVLARYLTEKGWDAQEVETFFDGEGEDG
ncbi:MAG: DNA ligase-associated DEXH box helicase, partial [Bacteroidota bacterium]